MVPILSVFAELKPVYPVACRHHSYQSHRPNNPMESPMSFNRSTNSIVFAFDFFFFRVVPDDSANR